MPATLSFTFPSSETTLWETRADALAFFESITVADASLATVGVVKKAASVSYTNFTAYTTSDWVELNLGGTTETLVPMATFEEVRTKLLAVTAGLNSLMTSLKSAGVLNS
jgi:hypothetical protein